MKTIKKCRVNGKLQQAYIGVFQNNNFSFSNEVDDWLVFIPRYGPTMKDELEVIENSENRYVMALDGSGSLSSRKRVWLNLVSHYGRRKSM